MADNLELTPADLAVATGAQACSVRPAGWRPTASLLLEARALGRVDSPAGADLHWVLASRHRPEDAATAEIRFGTLTAADAHTSRPVVLKLQRDEAGLNIRREAIEHRFNREQTALLELRQALPAELKEFIPATWNATGAERTAKHALRLREHIIFCRAANHALPVLGEYVESEDGRDRALQATIGCHNTACRGCAVYEHRRAAQDGGPIPAACRPWVVANRPGGVSGVVMEPSHVLILSDCGPSLQSQLDEQVEQLADASNLEAYTLQLLRHAVELARTLEAIHQAGWLHLDLNFDNLCVGSGRWRLIDFGHAERRTSPTDQVLADRIPLRRVDFAAPEMQMRSAALTVESLGENRLRVLGHIGWPASWLPRPGDLLSVPFASQGNAYRIRHRSFQQQQRECTLTVDSAVLQPATNPFRVTLLRTAGPAADVYSFGLMLLCRLFRIQKPIDLRDELAVFERALHRAVRSPVAPSRNDTPTKGSRLTERTWRLAYVRVFGRTSELFDRYKPDWESPLALLHDDATRTRLSWLFQELLAVGVRCVVRFREWTFTGADPRVDDAASSTPFTAIVQALQRILEQYDSGCPLPVIPEPITFDQFRKWLLHRYQVIARRGHAETRRPLAEQARAASLELIGILPQIRLVLEQRNTLKEALARLDANFLDLHSHYASRLRASSWWRYWAKPWQTLLRLLRPPAAHEDPGIISLRNDLATFAEKFERHPALDFKAAAEGLTSFSWRMTEWRQIMQQPGRFYGERAVLSDIDRTWQPLAHRLFALLNLCSASKSRVIVGANFHLGQLIEHLIAMRTLAAASREAISQELQQFKQQAKSKLLIMLPEHRDAARNELTMRIADITGIVKDLRKYEEDAEASWRRLPANAFSEPVTNDWLDRLKKRLQVVVKTLA